MPSLADLSESPTERIARLFRLLQLLLHRYALPTQSQGPRESVPSSEFRLQGTDDNGTITFFHRYSRHQVAVRRWNGSDVLTWGDRATFDRPRTS